MPESPVGRQWLEYDWDQPIVRLFVSFLVVVAAALSNYRMGLPSEFQEFQPGPRCSGGLLEAAQFIGAFLIALLLIESIGWGLRHESNREVLDKQEDEPSPYAPQSSPETIVQQSKRLSEYNIIKSGGGLVLTPKNSKLAFLVAMMAAAVAGVVGLPVPCAGAELTAAGIFRYLVASFIMLALVSTAQSFVSESSKKA